MSLALYAGCALLAVGAFAVKSALSKSAANSAPLSLPAGFNAADTWSDHGEGIALDRDAGTLAIRNGGGPWRTVDLGDVVGLDLAIDARQRAESEGSVSLTRAAVGGALLGPVGAVAGGLTGKRTSTASETVESVRLDLFTRSGTLSVEFNHFDSMLMRWRDGRDVLPIAKRWRALLAG